MPLKAKLKRLIGRTVPVDFLEKLTEYAIAEREPSVSLEKAEIIDTKGSGWVEIVERGREQLWEKTIARIPNQDILLLEFGVWQGESTRYFAKLISSAGSRFYGFDSFEGLPEDWRGTSTEHFDVGGVMPKIDDARVKFVKGWFQDSLPGMLDEIEEAARGRSLVVHYDADLYSSTLYLLFALGDRFKRYHFIFDEFSGHETRAFYNYMQATGAKAEFFYRLDWEEWPQIVSGEITIP